ncbi:response regulator [Ramlibacter sp.]|jgi:two-component system response regulator DesR|uniref:response regulator n=1 Tax=Ramlibacter sp. TaxID=1917967 RepID=UPI002FC80721|nr:response regulator receiver domain protein (CheY-like) [Ramlibacter sp.]
MHSRTGTATVTVFLADDSDAIRQRVNGLLQDAEFTVVGEGTTPQGCITGILAAHPDVVVLDHQLDGGTGLQVLQAVRLADPHVAFVVFSNNSAPAYRKRYLGEGATRFLDKSTEFDQLAGAVAAASGGQAVH